MKCDVLVLGGGPGGTVAALRLLERGITPLIVERETFPRFQIGESLTGEAATILRELGLAELMDHAGHPVKHGVGVFGRKGQTDWFVPVMRRCEDGLADATTWQVRRSDFDLMLMEAAISRGAGHLHGRATRPVVDEAGRLRGAHVELAGGREVEIRAPVTVDCTGQAAFLARHGVTGPRYVGAYDRQIALFSQVSGYRRDEGGSRETEPGNTHIFYDDKYRWSWAIPVDDDAVSVGVVCPASDLQESGLTREAFLEQRLRTGNPGRAERLNSFEFVEETRSARNYSYQIRNFAGPGFVCVGDAHRFVDPIFSFGVYGTMREAGYAADLVAGCLSEPGDTSVFAPYQIMVEKGLDALEDTIDVFWENPLAFSVMVHRRHREAFVDIFAGRIFDDMAHVGRDEALSVFRRLLDRTRDYEPGGDYSVPVGSRYHPERAPLYDSTLRDVDDVDAWLATVEP
jgi:flavin-dependent dehydrogenase